MRAFGSGIPVHYMYDSAHLACVGRDVVPDASVAAGHRARKPAALVLEFEARAVQLVLDEEFVKIHLFRPEGEGFGICGLFLAAHRYEMVFLGKTVGRFGVDGRKKAVFRFDFLELVP